MKTRKKIFLILLTTVLILQVILSALALCAGAADSEVSYTNAYNDLKRDSSFDESRYSQLSSSDPDYYKLEVITIAESENNELFVYVYQPSGQAGDLRAVSIDISTKERTAKDFINYKLTYLNSHGVFFKYKVEGLTISSDETRYYEISDILRPWNEQYDEKPGGDNTISEVGYPVGRLFTFSATSSMKVEDMEYIDIDEQFVGYVRYFEDVASFPLFLDDSVACDAHFVAFSTKTPIDKLLEASIIFDATTYMKYESEDVFSVYKSEENLDRLLDFKQKVIVDVSDGSILTKNEHIFDRIQETSVFLSQDTTKYIVPGLVSFEKEIEYSKEAKDELKKTQWVLSFYETNYMDYDLNYTMFSAVSDVKIMRLKFITDDVVYNLGVVSDKQTGSKDPAAVVEEQDWWQKIVMLLMLLVLLWALTFLSGPLGAFFKFLWNGIKILFKILVWILSRPWAIFKWLLGHLDKKRKPKSNAKAKPKDKPKGG